MRIRITHGRIEEIASEIMAIGIFEEEKRLKGKIEAIDKKLRGMIATAIKQGDFKGKFRQILVLPTQRLIPAKRVLLIGLGKKKEFKIEKLRQAAGTVARYIKAKALSNFSTIIYGKDVLGAPFDEMAQAVTEGILLSLYELTRFKTEKDKDKKEIKEISLCEEEKRNIPKIKEGLRRGQILSEATNLTRELVAYPSNEATPTFLANKAKEIAKKHHLKCKVMDRAEIKRLGMNAFLGVAKGSVEPPKFIILEYKPKKKNPDTIVLVGKGVTFDSGGITLKPGLDMYKMKEDMGGAAAVLGAMKAAAELGLSQRIVGLVPATENLPSGSALKPGDILKSYSGKTIEVLNTDAEGRLILCDALAYAARYKPKAIIDIATLTGACEIALGNFASGMMGNDEKLMARLKEAGNITGERVWELPLWEEYDELIKSDIADIKNVGGRAGGAITAAAFLKKFVEKKPWVHIDIAGTVWTKKDKSYISKGPTGVGVRLFIEFLRKWGK
ncbi:MAG TPA: leucyl aminopeptidase [Nitrospinota bacterium]|nr:leucyl aminopeptidase [Nitrospinota bacterium]